jgi:ornithine cyclodeaminase|tara:strand:+ start:1113 stop:1292 length:180 start_codon:yes stop_codon:yes gene_type:complete
MSEIYADLGELIVGKKPDRKTDQERTMSMNLDLALEDIGAVIHAYGQALEKKVGQRLPL